MGRRYSVSVRVVDSIVHPARTDHRTDYWWRGRTLNKLGIEQLGVDELARYKRRKHVSIKMILAVIQDQDAGPTLDALREREFGVTQIASSGSFWRQGNVTLLIGVSEQRVEEAIALLREQCHRRQELHVVPAHAGARFAIPSSYIEAEVGGAVVFVFNVEHFEQV